MVFLAQSSPDAAQGLFDAAFALFDRGGPVMWPILVCSLVALAVTFERLLAFWKYNTANFYFRNRQKEVLGLTRDGRFDEARTVARAADSPICRIFGSALENRAAGFLETLEAASQLELDHLRRGLSVLDTTITVAPMLGILGTVTGIINTFNMLNAAGMENPTGATAGIAEALITTATGLMIAFPVQLAYNLFTTRVNNFVLLMETTSAMLLETFAEIEEEPKPRS